MKKLDGNPFQKRGLSLKLLLVLVQDIQIVNHVTMQVMMVLQMRHNHYIGIKRITYMVVNGFSVLMGVLK